MNQGNFWELDRVSDDSLKARTARLLSIDRRVTARLLAHLAEIEQRRLHLEQAFSSMFDYCLSLGMSEDEAGRRLCAAGVAKRFPAIYGLLDEGRLSLSVICKLKHYLTAENYEELLAGVAGLSFRKAEAWLATRFERPDVQSTVRKLPERVTARALLTSGSAPSRSPATSSQPLSPDSDPLPTPAPAPPSALYPGPQSRVEPLSAKRYRVQFTADEALKEKLELAADLMAHRNANHDLAPIVEQALDLLIAALKKQKFGDTARPQHARQAKPERVTNSAKREVIERDGLQCSYVDKDGKRCAERGMLEFDHRHPRGRGGGSHADNLRILCRAHNQYLAELSYGRDRIEKAKRAREVRRDVAAKNPEKEAKHRVAPG